MQLMVAGDKWELYIPSDLAYGDRGSPPKIQGGDVLIFQMEILGILGDSVNAFTCRVDAPTEGCNERETKYMEKVKGWKETKVKSEVDRVHTILQKPMADELRDWARRRVHILQQLVINDREEEL
jgi:hypothetical protein